MAADFSLPPAWFGKATHGAATGGYRFLFRLSSTICVRDTGIGIADDAIHGIFDPFVQADSSTRRV